MMTSCACPKEAMACTSAGSRSSELAVAGGAAVRLQLAAVSARICSASGWYSSWNAASLSGASGEHHPRCAPGARSGVADGCIGASGVRASSDAAQMSGQRAPRRRRLRIQPRACTVQPASAAPDPRRDCPETWRTFAFAVCHVAVAWPRRTTGTVRLRSQGSKNLQTRWCWLHCSHLRSALGGFTYR